MFTPTWFRDALLRVLWTFVQAFSAGLVVLDVEAQADVEVVTRAMTELAECTLDRALAQARLDHEARYGTPRSLAWE